MQGDDLIIVDGSGDKVISGGGGEDTLQIALSGYDSLADFGVSGFGYPVEDYGDFYKDSNNDGIRDDAFPSWSASNIVVAGYYEFVTGEGDRIEASDIENIVVGEHSYQLVSRVPDNPTRPFSVQ